MVILRLSYFHFDSFVWAGCFQKSPAFIQAFWAHGCVQPSKLHSAKGRTKSFGQILLRRSWIAFTKQIPFVHCVLSVFWKQFHLSCVSACGNWASKSVRMAGFHMWGPSLSSHCLTVLPMSLVPLCVLFAWCCQLQAMTCTCEWAIKGLTSQESHLKVLAPPQIIFSRGSFTHWVAIHQTYKNWMQQKQVLRRRVTTKC